MRIHAANFLNFFQDYRNDVTEVVELVVPLFKDKYKLIVNANKPEKNKVGHLDMGVD